MIFEEGVRPFHAPIDVWADYFDSGDANKVYVAA